MGGALVARELAGEGELEEPEGVGGLLENFGTEVAPGGEAA